MPSTLEHEIEPELQEELRAYPGKWAAITRSRLVAVGETPAEALSKAMTEEPEENLILRHIPEREGISYFF